MMSDDDGDDHLNADYRNERAFELLLQRVRRNDASRTSVKFLNNPSSDNDAAAVALGDALLHGPNTSVASLDISIQQLSVEGRYQSLLDWIEHSVSLELVVLDGHGDHVQPTALPEVTERFLGAIQRSRRIQRVVLLGCYNISSSAIVDFLQLNSSIYELSMDCAAFSLDNTSGLSLNEELDRIAQGFRDNTNLRNLYFELDETTNLFVTPIVQSLGLNTTLQHLLLEFSWYNSDQRGLMDAALGQMLQQSQSLIHLELHDCRFVGDRVPHPIIGGLQLNRSLEKLTLQGCHFEYQAARQFRDAFGGTCIQQLNWLRTSVALSDGANDAVYTLLVDVMRSAYNLTRLHLDLTERQHLLCPIEFIAGLTESRLTDLALFDEIVVDALIDALPKLHNLTFLSVTLRTFHRQEQFRSSLKRNSSLLQCEVIPSRWSWERERILVRNRGIQAWRRTPVSLEPGYIVQCPLFFLRVGQCETGPTLIFQTLLGLGDATAARAVSHQSR
jgi:hypothetical protein